jgi:hypothetical protein
LRAGVSDVVLDLQAALERAYDAGPYQVRINYREPPESTLAPPDAEWASDLLQQAGLR